MLKRSDRQITPPAAFRQRVVAQRHGEAQAGEHHAGLTGGVQRDRHTAKEVREGGCGKRHATETDRGGFQRGLAGIGDDIALGADQGHIAEPHLVLRAGRSLFGFGHVVIIQ